MQTRDLDTKSAGFYAFAAARDARMRAYFKGWRWEEV